MGFEEKNLEERRSLGGISERAPSDDPAGCGSVTMAGVKLAAPSLPTLPTLTRSLLLMCVYFWAPLWCRWDCCCLLFLLMLSLKPMAATHAYHVLGPVL